MRKLFVVLAVVSLAFSTGCVSLARSEKEDLRTIKAAELGTSDEQVKSVPLAGFMNLFLGAGNFYLAVGTEESEQWIVGFMNLLTWPVSILWGIPQAAIDANSINKRETIYYYMKTDEGRKILEDALAKQKSYTPIRE